MSEQIERARKRGLLSERERERSVSVARNEKGKRSVRG